MAMGTRLGLTGAVPGFPGAKGPCPRMWMGAPLGTRTARSDCKASDGVPLVALERREDELDSAIEVEPGIDDQAAADREVERLEEIVQPGGFGIAHQCQDGPS